MRAVCLASGFEVGWRAWKVVGRTEGTSGQLHGGGWMVVSCDRLDMVDVTSTSGMSTVCACAVH